MMDRKSIAKAGDALFEAECSRAQIALISERHPDMDMDDAYAIQSAFVQRKSATNDAVVGWKIGLTSQAMQAALSIDIPDSGVLFESMIFPNGGAVAADRFIQPRIEAELAFVMKKPLSGEGLTVGKVLDATDYVVPALEILDTRIVRKSRETGNLRTVFDTIADNAANAGIVLGEPIHDFRDCDLRWAGAIVSRDGNVEETGLGAGVLDNPALAVVWLAERLGTYGDSIAAGQIVLSGSFIRPVEAPPGSSITADFGPFGVVECNFEAL